MPDIDSPHAFYLGRDHNVATGQTGDEPLLLKSAQLTTHAVCVGMTGSGKTGLCLSLLEEAALDGVPAIAIDPKGDLGNLMLAFPELRPDDFRPWIDETVAQRKGITPDAFAAETATLWRDGLAKWGEGPDRVRKFKEAVEVRIYTPGASHGLPLTVLKSFDAPPEAIRDDADAFRERVSSAVSGLLGLVGVDADPVRSREHIFLSTLLADAWSAGRDVGLADLIRAIQDPPMATVGVLPLDDFFPKKERTALAMGLNALVASPAFAGWMQGAPLSAKELLWSPEGKPRLSILSIAHLDDAQRMFFVTLLLSEVLAWMRTQPGTGSLRALLYMDEVFGYFPPTANPPSKGPMLTLLKQARAFGVGVVLATQNPVDLDYKGLSNCGVWLLGRLQTERDKMRVMDGLEGASAQAGSSFDKKKMEATLAALGSRVFLMNNVHEDAPRVFLTRWAMSYLAGPLARDQIKRLMDPFRPPPAPTRSPVAPPPAPPRGEEAPAESAPAEPTAKPSRPSVSASPDAATGAKLRAALDEVAKRERELNLAVIKTPFAVFEVLWRVGQLVFAQLNRKPTTRKTSSAWAATGRAGESASRVAQSWTKWRAACADAQRVRTGADEGSAARLRVLPALAWIVVVFYLVVTLLTLTLLVAWGQSLLAAFAPPPP